MCWGQATCLHRLLAEIGWAAAARLPGVVASSQPSSWPICLSCPTAAGTPSQEICCGFLGEGMWLVGIPLVTAVVSGHWPLQNLSLQGLSALQQSHEGQCRGWGSQQGFLSPLLLLSPVWGLHGTWEHVGSVAQKLQHRALLFLLSLSLLEKKTSFSHSYSKCLNQRIPL